MKNSLKQSAYTSCYGYINNHFSVIGNIKLKDLTSRTLQDFYNYKLNEEGLSPKTITNMNLCLHKALKQAELERFLTFNPCDAVNLPKINYNGSNRQITSLKKHDKISSFFHTTFTAYAA